MKFIILLLGIVCCASCSDLNSDKKTENCPTPPPEAIFKKETAGISDHNFKLSNRDSEESLQLADGTQVTIYQSGCEKIAQEYRFTMPAVLDQSPASLAIERLIYLSRLGPDYITFGGWAEAIKKLRSEFELTNTVEVEAGFFVSLDKLDSKERTIMIIKLYQK